MNQIKLYQLHTSVLSFKDHFNVKIEWYKHGTNWEDVDYSLIINGYDDLEGGSKQIMRHHANTYFRKEELRVFKKVLDAIDERGWETSITQIQTPIQIVKILIPAENANEEEAGITKAVDGDDDTNNEEGSIVLNDYDEKGILPFTVKGYYDLSESLSEQNISDTQLLFHAILDEAYPDIDRSEELISSYLIDRLFQDHGLYVARISDEERDNIRI